MCRSNNMGGLKVSGVFASLGNSPREMATTLMHVITQRKLKDDFEQILMSIKFVFGRDILRDNRLNAKSQMSLFCSL